MAEPKFTRENVGAAMRSAGFNEAQATENFSWFEHPSGRWQRGDKNPFVSRVQFFFPTGEMDSWIYSRCQEDHFITNIDPLRRTDFMQDLEDVHVRAALALRDRALGPSINAARRAGVKIPPALLHAAYADVSGGVGVLNDWLWENGVKPL